MLGNLAVALVVEVRCALAQQPCPVRDDRGTNQRLKTIKSRQRIQSAPKGAIPRLTEEAHLRIIRHNMVSPLVS